MRPTDAVRFPSRSSGYRVAAAIASTSAALIRRPEFRAVQDTLDAVPGMPSMLWIGVSAFVLAILVLVPLELLAIAAGVLFGALRGGVVALRRIAGRGRHRLRGWPRDWTGRTDALDEPRDRTGPSGSSAREASSGVLVLRLASVASAGSIHLLCGAGRVPFATYLAGTAIGLVPAIAALSGLGALLRHTLLHPSVSERRRSPSVAALLLIACAAALRTLPPDPPVRAIGVAAIASGRSSADADVARRRFGSRPTTCTRASAPTDATIPIAWPR